MYIDSTTGLHLAELVCGSKRLYLVILSHVHGSVSWQSTSSSLNILAPLSLKPELLPVKIASCKGAQAHRGKPTEA